MTKTKVFILKKYIFAKVRKGLFECAAMSESIASKQSCCVLADHVDKHPESFDRLQLNG